MNPEKGVKQGEETADRESSVSHDVKDYFSEELESVFDKHLSESFPIQNGLKQGDALSPLLFNFTLEYAIRKVQVNQVGLKLNRAHQLLGYADDVNLLVDNIETIKKNTETLIDVSKEVSLEINVEKPKYMLLSRHQNAGQNQNIKIANKTIRKCVTVRISGNDSNELKFY
jgi:hypothetical protein